MNITFIGIGYEQLGISQLSAILKKQGHKVSLAYTASIFHDRYNIEMPGLSKYFNDDSYVLQQIKEQQPELIAFSALTSTYQWMLSIARKAKEMNPHVKTVFGGVHPSAVPALVLARPEVDYIVVGEGDLAFPAIARAIETKNFSSPIDNTRYKDPTGKVISGIQKGFNQDLDLLPFYDKRIWEDHVRIQDMYLTMASRGCPYRCTFCFNNFFAKLPEEKSGKYVRLRSVEHMIAELKHAKKRYDIRWVDFEDDVFTTNKKWLESFLPLYKKEINRPFKLLTHPKYMDDDIAHWLKEAGAEWIQMGVQSMDESFKKDSLLRFERSDDIASSLESMIKHGLHVKVDHMFGLPNEPITAQKLALDLYQTHTPARIQTFWTCYLPGTEMMQKAVDEKKLTEEQTRRINEGEEFYFFRNTDNVKDPELMELYKIYEVIFRILPAIPAKLRKKATVKFIAKMPSFVFRPFSVIADIIIGITSGNPDFAWYAKHNLFQILNFTLRKIGFKGLKASRIVNDVDNVEEEMLVLKQAIKSESNKQVQMPEPVRSNAV